MSMIEKVLEHTFSRFGWLVPLLLLGSGGVVEFLASGPTSEAFLALGGALALFGAWFMLARATDTWRNTTEVDQEQSKFNECINCVVATPPEKGLSPQVVSTVVAPALLLLLGAAALPLVVLLLGLIAPEIAVRLGVPVEGFWFKCFSPYWPEVGFTAFVAGDMWGRLLGPKK